MEGTLPEKRLWGPHRPPPTLKMWQLFTGILQPTWYIWKDWLSVIQGPSGFQNGLIFGKIPNSSKSQQKSGCFSLIYVEVYNWNILTCIVTHACRKGNCYNLYLLVMFIGREIVIQVQNCRNSQHRNSHMWGLSRNEHIGLLEISLTVEVAMHQYSNTASNSGTCEAVLGHWVFIMESENHHVSGKWHFRMVFWIFLFTGMLDWAYSFSIGFAFFS